MVTLAEYLDHFTKRMLQDALAEATAAFWLRRAEDFEAAKPIAPPEGFRDPEAARERWRRCHETAKACRAAAEVVAAQDFVGDLERVLAELDKRDRTGEAA